MMDDLDQTAASFVLGLLRSDEREALEARLQTDPALQARIDRWGADLAPLDLAAAVDPPDGEFDAILARLDAEALPGTVTQRAISGVWQPLSPGVMCRVLRDDPETGRRSMLIRLQPGAVYQAHGHAHGDEECLVIEGDLSFGALTLRSGDFHVARRGMTHPASSSVRGCLLHITTPLQ